MTKLIIPLGTEHPDACAECGNILQLREGDWGPYYKCIGYGCTGSASAHADGRPMGHTATKDVKFQRIIVHKFLDQLKEQQRWNGDRAYRWLQDVFRARETPHIGNMNTDQLRIVLREMQKLIKYR
jgi:hypothetical protein